MSVIRTQTSRYWDASTALHAPVMTTEQFGQSKARIQHLAQNSPFDRLRAVANNTLKQKGYTIWLCPAPDGGDAA